MTEFAASAETPSGGRDTVTAACADGLSVVSRPANGEHELPVESLELKRIVERLRASTQTPCTIDEINNFAREAAVPAALYGGLLRLTKQLGLVHSQPTSDSQIPDSPPTGTEARDAGWDNNGLEEFLRRTRHEVLTAPQEQKLGQRISEGRLASTALSNAPTDDPVALRVLRRKVERGRAAEDELAMHNIRLVAKIANKHRHATSPAIELEDLIQEGYIGLAHAIQKWDHRRGLKFSTYASWWIRQHVDRAIKNQAAAIRLPVHAIEKLRAVRRAETELRRNGVATTSANVAEIMQISRVQVEKLRKLPIANVSLDRPLSGSRANLGDLIPDPFQDSVEIAAEYAMLQELVEDTLSTLSEREQEVMRMRFGLDGGMPKTLEEVGREFRVTRERIRQIEAKTIVKLQHPQRSAQLRAFFEADLNQTIKGGQN